MFDGLFGWPNDRDAHAIDAKDADARNPDTRHGYYYDPYYPGHHYGHHHYYHDDHHGLLGSLVGRWTPRSLPRPLLLLRRPVRLGPRGLEFSLGRQDEVRFEPMQADGTWWHAGLCICLSGT